ncbi:MAG: SufS family cysteine desulfurase [Planctomycetia bacterium]
MSPAPAAPAAGTPARGTRALDVQAVRAEFPILARRVHGKPLVYLDHAATTQKPRAVLEALDTYYRQHNANVHRAVHLLSAEATQAYDRARERVRDFLGARDAREVVFVRGTTEAINVVAQGWLRPRLQPGDEVLVSAMEHHSNLVPWQMVAAAARARVRYVPYSDAGVLDLDALSSLLGPRTRLLAVGHVSNALGTVHPVAEIVRRAHAQGVPVLVDGAQGAPHLLADVQALGCDFYAFSGHKVYGPTGIGVLWGRRERLEEVEPVQGGGDMIRTVTLEGSTWADLPARLEAGTPHIAGAIGLGAALDWLSAFDRAAVQAHEADVAAYGAQRLAALPRTRLIGTPPVRAGVASFVVDGVHPHDLGTILDREGVAIRTGHHCAQPVMDRYGVPATARASFGITSTREEVDALCAAVEKAIRMFVR